MTLHERFHAVVQSHGRRADWSPAVFVEAWSDFVDQVVSGYSGDLYEYENDLSVRDDLELALNDEELKKLDAWALLAERIGASDESFRNLLARGPVVHSGVRWWHERLPPYAGDDLAADASRVLAVHVEAD